jgi:hypothetical protein
MRGETMKKIIAGIPLLMISCWVFGDVPPPTPSIAGLPAGRTESPTEMATAAALSITPTLTVPATLSATETTNGDCDPYVVVGDLERIVPYEHFTLTFNIIRGSRYFVFWMIDPELNPLAAEGELEENVALAEEHAMALAHQLLMSDRCVAGIFDAFNPVVVDAHYNGWFSGLIDLSDVPSKDELSDEDMREMRNAVYNKWERFTVPEVVDMPEESCTWTEVKEKVGKHFYQSVLNAYMLVHDNNGMTFTVQYSGEDAADDMLTFLNTRQEVGCLVPPVEIIVVIIVDYDGVLRSVNQYAV